MRVLIACESSGRVRTAFRLRGHETWSCDLNAAEDGSIYHFQEDVFEVLKREPPFDLVIAHPPCTYLCNSGVRWLYQGGKKKLVRLPFLTMRGQDITAHDWNWDTQRVEKFSDAKTFWRQLREAILNNNPKAKFAFENPVMHRYALEAIGDATQFIQPWMFGDKAFKNTGLWLEGLPKLVENPIISLRDQIPKRGTKEHKEWSAIHRASPGPQRAVERSRTFEGIAIAMANTWG